MIRINKNESPVPSLSEEKIREIIQETPFFRYPAEEHDRFVEAYAKFHHLDPKCIAIANGSDEWIQKFMILLGEGPMMTLDPDFSMYEGYARQLKRPVIKVPCNDDFTFDEERTVQAIREHKPSFFIFSQPNNPTGAMHSDSFVEAIAAAVTEAGGYLVVDEAYLEFSSRSYEKPTGDNVIVIRTPVQDIRACRTEDWRGGIDEEHHRDAELHSPPVPSEFTFTEYRDLPTYPRGRP